MRLSSSISVLYFSNYTTHNIPVNQFSIFQRSSNIKFQYSLDCSSNSCIFLIWCHLCHRFMYTNYQIPNFDLSRFSASFKIFIVPFLIGQHFRHIIFQCSTPYYFRSRSISCLSSFCFLVFCFHTACTNAFFSLSSPFASGSALWRHLGDGTRNPSIGRAPSAILTSPVCRQFPLLLT